MKKRLGIYFFFNKDGVVGDYVTYYLKKLREHCSEICVVVNAPLTTEGRMALEKNADRLLVRENKGYDSWAYKYAIENYGYERLKSYDELILSNFTCYGPIFPFDELFKEMDSRPCDFWGINRHPEIPIFLTSDKNSYIYAHLQSYFLVFRSTILKDIAFQNYWETLEPVNNYQEAIVNHEIRCTRFFEGKGFTSSSFMNYEKYSAIVNDNASLLCADQQLIKDRNPLLKRKVFFLENIQWLENGLGHTAMDCLAYIKDHTDYDSRLIWQDLLATQKMSVLRSSLHLNYFLPKTVLLSEPKNKKIALVIFVYYEDLVDYCYKYILSMPKGADIYIVSSKQELLNNYKSIFSNNSDYNTAFRLVEPLGRDVAGYLIGARDVFSKYDYICCVHDKKSLGTKKALVGQEFSHYCFENNLASKIFVENIITTFNNHPFLGLLVPPPINIAQYYFTLGPEFGANRKNLLLLYKKLRLTVPFDDSPVAPYGTMFWVRGGALKYLFNYNWQYSDFPKEPAPTDGTIMHAVERIYPLCVQQSGYYTGWLATEDLAKCYLDNNVYMLEEFNKVLLQKLGPTFNFRMILAYLNSMSGLTFKNVLYLFLAKVNQRYFSSFKLVLLKKLIKRILK